jgi:hypothetical protein
LVTCSPLPRNGWHERQAQSEHPHRERKPRNLLYSDPKSLYSRPAQQIASRCQRIWHMHRLSSMPSPPQKPIPPLVLSLLQRRRLLLPTTNTSTTTPARRRRINRHDDMRKLLQIISHGRREMWDRSVKPSVGLPTHTTRTPWGPLSGTPCIEPRPHKQRVYCWWRAGGGWKQKHGPHKKRGCFFWGPKKTSLFLWGPALDPIRKGLFF